jgi:alcohol dehydrogenase (NADP+)
MTTVPARAAASAKQALEPTTIERRSARPNDVVIDIKYSGICHSDIHQARDEWDVGIYPMVPGHEIAGIVTEVGGAVTRHRVGDRVGVGTYVDSCRECEYCLAGQQNYCLKGEVGTYNSRDYDAVPTLGGYSSQIVVDENYVLSIPDGIDLADAAPLLCAGITMYSPLKHWAAGPGTKLAIIGMGGLGHMGVKLGHALGADVTVLSQTLNKRDDGLRMGADHYFATNDPATFSDLADRFDLIINTVSANLTMRDYLRLLALDGTLVHVGIPTDPDPIKMSWLADRRRSLAASKIGSIPDTQEMLDFCAANGLGAEVEVIGADDVNDAFERVIRSDVRYRFVIDGSTF